jgi:predicted AlkP superfamily phosphohydrolase/phosphomutase
MRFLRMFTNALVVGALASMYVLALILQLNPALSVTSFVPLALTVGVFYAVQLTVIAYALLVVRQLLQREVFSPAWTSVRVITWLAAGAAAAGAAVMWANVRTFGLVMEADATRGLLNSAIVLAAVAVILIITAITQAYGGSRRWWAVWVAVVAALSVAAPLALRTTSLPLSDERALGEPIEIPRSDVRARVTVIALDAGSLELITNATTEGRLPNFGRMLDRGAVAHLATLHPTSAEAVWSAIATGKLPQKNGVRSSAVYQLAARREHALQLLPDFCFASGLVRFGILIEEPRTSASLKSRTIWAILSAAGIDVGVVNFPLTYPAPPVRGFVVSDAYLRLADTLTELSDPASVYPASLQVEASAVTGRADASPAVPATMPIIAQRHRAAARADHAYDALARALSVEHHVQVALVRYQSPDPIGHYFLRYAMPARFGDVSDEDRRRYGGVLEAHYGIVDEAIGRAIEELGPDDLLLVVSGFGMEPLGIGKRALERLIGDPDVSGTHEAAPDGFLMAYGAMIAPRRQLRRGSVVDVVPTILYFLGLPMARDMDGYARTDLFLPSFTEERPITFIPTYDR